MTGDRGFVIVGASLAGAKAAQTLRDEGFDGPIVLIGDEAAPPLRAAAAVQGLPAGQGRAGEGLRPPRGLVRRARRRPAAGDRGHRARPVPRTRSSSPTASGSATTRLLLATGSSPRGSTCPAPTSTASATCAGSTTARPQGRLRARPAGSSIIGAGWIGLETAAAARAAGLEVTVLEAAELPLLRVLGAEVATVFADLHRDHGVDLRLGVQVAELAAADGAVDRRPARRRQRRRGRPGAGRRRHPAERPSWPSDAGLDVDNGIVVDAHLRTADPRRLRRRRRGQRLPPELGQHVRVEHWANARRQGATAAKSMLGQDVDYDRLPYFFTDQYDLGMEYTGYAEPGGYDRVVFRGDRARRRVHRVLARRRHGCSPGMNVNVWDVTEALEGLVLTGRTVDVDRLTDPEVPLTDL